MQRAVLFRQISDSSEEEVYKGKPSELLDSKRSRPESLFASLTDCLHVACRLHVNVNIRLVKPSVCAHSIFCCPWFVFPGSSKLYGRWAFLLHGSQTRSISSVIVHIINGN